MAKVLRLVACLALALVVGAPALRAEEEGAPQVTTRPTEKGCESKIRILLPTEDARLYVDNLLTRKIGKDRAFRSPALEEGKRYTYRVVAVWIENGQQVEHETRINFRAGEDVVIDFRH